MTGVTAGGEFFAADAVISTMPTPHVSRIVPDLPSEERARYDAIANIGVVCVVFRLKRSVTPHFWVNIVRPALRDPRHRRVLQSAADRRHGGLHSLLHAGDASEVRQGRRVLPRRRPSAISS